MSETTIIRNAQLINEDRIYFSDLLIKSGRIERIDSEIGLKYKANEINGDGLKLIPGAIDDQVHFREPGLTHKGEIATESAAAVAGGVTSFMEMPNTVPAALTQTLLEEKYKRASECSPANYSFFMGASNDNLEEVLKTDSSRVCGIKVFMGSSTGNMLVDNQETLEQLFSKAHMLVAAHCEDEATVRSNFKEYKDKYGDKATASLHPLIRNEEACYLSSSRAVALAKKYGTRFHVLHISTAKELELFSNDIPLEKKLITAEACIHHLWFSEEDYESKGNLIKWNPAIKKISDRDAIRAAVNTNRIDIIATDHAPHTWEEKQLNYFDAPSGGPLVQHSIQAMFELHVQGVFSLEKIVEKISHAPAKLFRIKERGFLREGYHADLVLVDPNKPQKVSKQNLLYKCKWSPFEGQTFSSSIHKTFVNGELAFDGENVNSNVRGMRLEFDRR